MSMQQAGQEMAACLMLLLGDHGADITEIAAVAIAAVIPPYLSPN